MATVTFATVKDQLELTWAGGVIPFPHVMELPFDKSTKNAVGRGRDDDGLPRLAIKIGNTEAVLDALGNIGREKKTEFEIKIWTKTDDQMNKCESESEDSVREKVISGGWWEVIDFIRDDESTTENLRIRTLICKETLYEFT